MMYKGSKGEVEIATMPLSFARNAMNKLLRTEPERTAEIEALTAHVEKLEAEAMAGKPDAAPDNPRVVIGGNNPPPDAPAPKLDSRSAVEAHADDLLLEAGNWADGFVIENQDQADVVGRLMRQLQDAAALIDKAAANEKRPLNDAIAEIATWQNSYVAKGLKKTPDGKLTKAILATGNMVSAWLNKLDAERRQREAAAAEAARTAAQEAIAAHTEAKTSTDIAKMDTAEDAMTEARNLLRAAEGVSKEKVRSGGGEGLRAVGLRSYWHAEITDSKAALLHYLKQYPERFRALVQELADADARTEAGRGATPGISFIETKKAA